MAIHPEAAKDLRELGLLTKAECTSLTKIEESDESWEASAALLSMDPKINVDQVLTEQRLAAADDLHTFVGMAMTGWDVSTQKTSHDMMRALAVSPGALIRRKNYATSEEFSQEEIGKRFDRVLGIDTSTSKSEGVSVVVDAKTGDVVKELEPIVMKARNTGLPLTTLVNQVIRDTAKTIEGVKMPGITDGKPAPLRYSKAQIGQALANQKRALRAGNKLRKKQKAAANKYKSY